MTEAPLRALQAMRRLLLPLVGAALVGGGVAWYLDHVELSGSIWIAATAVVLAGLLAEIALSLRRGEFGLDLIAALSMAGALLLGEQLAGIIIALMYTGGQALEDYAQRRARGEMTALLSRMPRSAARYTDGELEEVALDAIARGDRLLVRRGEVVAVDGTVAAGVAVLDEAALTGEALPVRRAAGEAVLSGSTNAGDAFDLEATNTAADSTYAGIVRMVEAAQAAKAPMSRLADRYALGFLAVTLAIAGAAWAFSGDPVRALAVLVVATPCPLILAVPVAIISGVSRAAKKGVLVKGGGALEQLAAARIVLLDKTGTITEGRARLIDARVRDGMDEGEVLSLAASLDQASHHIIAEALVAAARQRGMQLATPGQIREVPGAGVTGQVEGHSVAVGGWDFVSAEAAPDAFAERLARWIRRDGVVAVAVAVDGVMAGAFLFADQVRPEAGRVLRQLRDAEVQRIVLVTGDRADLAESVAAFLGVDAVVSEMKPEDKIDAVRAERGDGPVMMVGDGVNDAPALAAADIGVAMGARGAAASSEAADVVVLVDRLDRVVSALHIARRSRAIALQSVYAGIGMSMTAMLVAAFGYLTPVQGAILQEVIDVAVILNALRALGAPLLPGWSQPRLERHELTALEAEHRELAEVIEAIRSTAEQVGRLPADELAHQLEALETLLSERLLRHERDDDNVIYARIREQQRTGIDPLAGMSRTHMEIQRQIHGFSALRRALTQDGPDAAQRYELQRLLHGLEAVTRLHFAQEEEIYRSLEAD